METLGLSSSGSRLAVVVGEVCDGTVVVTVVCSLSTETVVVVVLCVSVLGGTV